MELDNGVRLAHAVRDQRLSAVCVLQEFGFVDDPPSRAGLAHLIEHFAAAEDFSGAGVANVGHLNGRTRFDSIDFYGVADNDDIQHVVDRMAGRFTTPPTAATLARQVDVVIEELRTQMAGRHLGGFPWTELPAAIFDDWAHAHNGYGTEDSARAISLKEIVDGLETVRRRPTTVGLVGPLRSRSAVIRAFEALPRTIPQKRPAADPKATDSTIRSTSGHPGPRAMAAGVLVSGARHDARAANAARVVARMLKRAANMGDSGPATRSEDFGVGFFGRFSTLTPDVFIATAFVEDGLDPEQRRRRIRRTLKVASEAPEESIVAGVIDEFLHLTAAADDWVTLARYLASRARSVDASTDALSAPVEVQIADVREIAHALSVAPMGLLDRSGLGPQ